jgi:hypothetical protein
MERASGIEAHQGRSTSGYSAAVRTVLSLTAIVITLLPIPVTYFGIIPAFQRHAWFLLFYAPFLCLLTLCYLFYVRDSLARTTFANVLDPPPPADVYYGEPLGQRVKRGFRRLKALLLGILPALLVLSSMYCVSRYFATFDQSVALASLTYQERWVSNEPTGALPETTPNPTRRRSARAPTRSRVTEPGQVLTRDSLPSPSDSNAVRKYVLQSSAIDDIPHLLELTAWYVGAFVSLLVAVTLMALKEYAKEALGLSEHDLMFGRYRTSGTED